MRFIQVLSRYLPARFLALDIWLQIAFALLALPVVALAALILLNALAFTLGLLKPDPNAHMKRSEGFAFAGLGFVLMAFGITLVTLPDWMPFAKEDFINRIFAHIKVLSFGALAAGVYAFSEGIGAVVFARSRVGVVMLIWALIVGIGWQVANAFP